MFSNLSATIHETTVSYPITDSTLPFSDYIARTRAIIEERRVDLQKPGINANQVIEANCPFELYPDQPIQLGKKLKYGALLIHGLLDSPFSLRDIGKQFQANGILSRAILLPGHGTTPSDLLNISYHDWIQAVRYGVESLRNEVDEIFLVGYSTGATLSIYQALQDIKVAGVILLSPAIRIRAPVDIVVDWHYFMRWTSKNKEWFYVEDEDDYAKYCSIPFNAVAQVSKLTGVIHELRQQHSLILPMMMVLSREDETISSSRAMEFFSSLRNRDSKMLLYTSIEHRYPDPRIETRLSTNHEQQIKHFSHISIPFAPSNSHYGVKGDYEYASHPEKKEYIYGAYNRIEVGAFNLLNKLGLSKFKRKELSYNPDFNYMAKELVQFIKN